MLPAKALAHCREFRDGAPALRLWRKLRFLTGLAAGDGLGRVIRCRDEWQN
jgi:hypothetical protein